MIIINTIFALLSCPLVRSVFIWWQYIKQQFLSLHYDYICFFWGPVSSRPLSSFSVSLFVVYKHSLIRQRKTRDALTADLTELQALSADIERLAGSARQIQNDVERLADDVNRANLERASIGNRVTANEEWVESINGFRKQVNANVSQLRADIRQLSAQVEAAASMPTVTPAQSGVQ